MRVVSIAAIFMITFKMLETAYSAPLVPEPNLSVEECRQETGATEADIETLYIKSKSTSMAAKCMRACLMKKFKLMDANGKFNREMALLIVDEYVGKDSDKMRIALDIVDACNSMVVSENHCEAADQYGKCANKRAREIHQ